MAPRPDVSEERKDQIIDAATNVFTRLGFKKARMDDIVKESGLSKGALYWYFKSKDELIIAIVERMFSREVVALDDIAKSDASTRAALEGFFEVVLKDLEKLEPFFPLMYEFYGMAGRSKAISQFFSTYFEKYMSVLTPLIQIGIDKQEFIDTDAEKFAMALAAALEGMLVLKIYAQDKVDLNENIIYTTQLLLDSVTIKKE